MRPRLLTIVSCLSLACAPTKPGRPYPGAPPAPGEPYDPNAAATGGPVAAIARFFDREIDVAPFLAGFPYTRFIASLETGELFFIEVGEHYRLRQLVVGDGPRHHLDLENARVLGDIDWSKRSLWDIRHPPGSGRLWLHADANNDERMNLWTLDLTDGSVQQVTDHDYVYDFGFDAARRRIAYLPRAGKKAPYSTCLHVLEVETGNDRKVVCDSPALSFSWGEPRFSPDGNQVYFNAQIEGDRTRVQIVEVDLRSKRPRPEIVTDSRTGRNAPTMLEGWVDGDLLLFRANDDGFHNLYAYSRKTGKTRRLTDFREDLTSAKLSDHGVVGVHRTPAGSTLVLIDPRTGRVHHEEALPGTADVIDAHGSSALLSHESPDIPFEAWWIDVKSTTLARRKVVALDPELERKIVACKASAVKIPTFDQDPATRHDRLLHAFVLEPREPVGDPRQRLAMVRAFYGGENTYTTYDQIMCAAGIVLVSPAVRGSSGFGKEFYSLNDKDLGGDEIVDLFHVARWSAAHTGLPPARVGVYGRSHGGYATLRALTFPERSERGERFAFGFGLADAGFSDIKAFYDATNIPDWVVLESGDPRKPDELARMIDRSPITHVERLVAPLLLIHGSNDWRVPVEESRRFAARARELGKPVQYVEFEGQGHHVEGLDLQVREFQVRFDFLMAVAKQAPNP